jgi:transcriptional regulator
MTHLLRGTLHLLILRSLAEGPRHGFAIAEAIGRRSGGVITFEEGALYQALHRMEEREWLASTWAHAESGKRARFYRLTADGRRQLQLEAETFSRYARAVFDVLAVEVAS